MKLLPKIKALASLKAFIHDEPLIFKIIELCDLYPAEGSWRKWTDHLGNYIQVYNSKKIVSFINDPLDQHDIIITDIYFNSSPKIISSISNWAFISFGRDQTHSFNTLYIWFLGRDNRLRFLTYHNGNWLKNESPLVSGGVDVLRPVLRNINVNNYTQADILRIKGPIAMDITRSWATKWPPDKNLIKEMEVINNQLTKVVNNLYE